MKKNSELIAERDRLEKLEGKEGWNELMAIDAEIAERTGGQYNVTAAQLDRLFHEGK